MLSRAPLAPFRRYAIAIKFSPGDKPRTYVIGMSNSTGEPASVPTLPPLGIFKEAE